MSQRINISYSIKLEALASETNRLYTALLDEINTAADRYKAPSEVLSPETLKEIAEIKDFTRDLNYRLVDIEGIVKSYLNYISEDPPASPDGTNMESMYDKLGELAKKLGMEKNEHEISD